MGTRPLRQYSGHVPATISPLSSEKHAGINGPQADLIRGREIIAAEIDGLDRVSQQLDDRFSEAIDLLAGCRGKVITCGIGKAGLIAQKISASLSSTGTPSVFLHPSEAVHGDLGMVQSADVVLLLSYSGETEEVTRLLPALAEQAAGLIAITASAGSTLARKVDCAVLLGRNPEACSLNLAPSSSTTAMMAVGDALTLIASERREFTREQFATYHPGGSLGKQLSQISDVMRPLEECRIASEQVSVRQVMIDVCRPGRRTGAIMLTDTDGKLSGVFTDSDLARMLESDSAGTALDRPVEEVMSRRVRVTYLDGRLTDAVRLLSSAKISELPVIDDQGAPAGIIDVTDVVEVLAALPAVDPLGSAQKKSALDQPECEHSEDDLPKILPLHRPGT